MKTQYKVVTRYARPMMIEGANWELHVMENDIARVTEHVLLERAEAAAAKIRAHGIKEYNGACQGWKRIAADALKVTIEKIER